MKNEGYISSKFREDITKTLESAYHKNGRNNNNNHNLDNFNQILTYFNSEEKIDPIKHSLFGPKHKRNYSLNRKFEIVKRMKTPFQIVGEANKKYDNQIRRTEIENDNNNSLFLTHTTKFNKSAT